MCKFEIRIVIFCKSCIFSPGPKVLSANFVYVCLAQKYLVQILYFLPGPKVFSANTALFRLAQNNYAKVQWKLYKCPWTQQILMCKFGLWNFAKIVFFRLAQKYLVQILYFFAWPKILSANTALFRLAQNNFTKNNGSCKNALTSNRFWCVNSDCDFLQILCCFRLAQTYLVQILYFSSGSKGLSANTALFRLAPNNCAKVQWKL